MSEAEAQAGTPRTDAAIVVGTSFVNYVPIWFARQLEKELAEAQAECTRLRTGWAGAFKLALEHQERAESAEKELAEVKAALAEANQEAERLTRIITDEGKP